MTRNVAKGGIGVANQEIARYVTRYEQTQKLEICTMGAMLRTDTRGIYKKQTKISIRNLMLMMMGSVIASRMSPRTTC